MLTVAADATPLVGDRTGIGVAVSGLIRCVAARGDVDLVGYGLTLRGWRRLRGILPAGARPARAPMPAGLLLKAWGGSAFPPVEIWTGAIDVVHGTNYVVPPARRAKRLVSVWDLTAVHYPELCTPTSRLYPHLVRRAVREGAWVHTGSRFVATEIVAEFGADPDRVRVIAPGVEPAPTDPYRPSGPCRRPHPSRRPHPARPAGRPYILALGTTEPRKDFSTLVSAFDLIAGEHPELELLIGGPPGWAERRLADSIAESPYRARIRRLGWVPDTSTLIAGAEAFVYPSMYEGFGFPPLEAMALGVPVVTTDAGSIPEVVGGAALIVPVGDAPALAGAIGRVLTETALRGDLIEAGRARAQQFTWHATADSMHALYEEIAASR